MLKYIALSLCMASQLYAMLPSEKVRSIFKDEKLAQRIARGEENHPLRISLICTPKEEWVQFVRASESENSVDQVFRHHLQSRLASNQLSPNQKLFFAIALQDTTSFEALLDSGATGDAVQFENETDRIFGPSSHNAFFYLAHLITAYEKEQDSQKDTCMEMLKAACTKAPDLMRAFHRRSARSPASILSRSQA